MKPYYSFFFLSFYSLSRADAWVHGLLFVSFDFPFYENVGVGKVLTIALITSF